MRQRLNSNPKLCLFEWYHDRRGTSGSSLPLTTASDSPKTLLRAEEKAEIPCSSQTQTHHQRKYREISSKLRKTH